MENFSQVSALPLSSISRPPKSHNSYFNFSYVFLLQVDELKELLSTKKDELEKLQERENTLNTTLNNTIGDGNKFETFLIKVYKKKIKRVKKKTSNEGERKTTCLTKGSCLGEYLFFMES